MLRVLSAPWSSQLTMPATCYVSTVVGLRMLAGYKLQCPYLLDSIRQSFNCSILIPLIPSAHLIFHYVLSATRVDGGFQIFSMYK